MKLLLTGLIAESPSMIKVKGSKLQLRQKDVSWDYIEEPHLLIGGGTGGGKTVVLMTIIYA